MRYGTLHLWIKSFTIAINDSYSSYWYSFHIFKTLSSGSEVYKAGYAYTQNNGSDQQQYVWFKNMSKKLREKKITSQTLILSI